MESQKSNIPKLIIAVFVSFAMFIGYMVYQAFQTDVNLVQTDYYQNSTKHDEHVADIERSDAVDIQLYFDRQKGKVFLDLPNDFEVSKVEGKVYFYRPSDSRLDFIIPINFQNENSMWINMKTIEKGKWIAKVNFSFNGKQYYKESTFVK